MTTGAKFSELCIAGSTNLARVVFIVAAAEIIIHEIIGAAIPSLKP
jgi:hypothetical protein